jgi:hypothetical protein
MNLTFRLFVFREAPMLDSTFVCNLHQYKPGDYLYTVGTPWRDETSSAIKNVKFQAVITGRYGDWRVRCDPLCLDAVASTLKEAQHWVDLSVKGLTGHDLALENVWRNSGGFLCVDGRYSDAYLYVAHGWYGGQWELRAISEGAPDLRFAGDNLATLIANAKEAIEQRIVLTSRAAASPDLAWLIGDLPF